MNSVQLLGRIGRDPEKRATGGGTVVTSFSLATNKRIKGEDKTSWHRCIAFGKTAELISQYVTKGQMLAVEGEISYGSYDREGNTIYTTDIIVNRIHFTGDKKSGTQGGGQGSPQAGNNNYSQPGYENTHVAHEIDESIPF